MTLPITGVFAGAVQPMPGDGRPTAIFKQPVRGRVRIGPEGLRTDAQADRRVHGGPEKAVHHFPAETYRALAQAFPEAAGTLLPGALGENISTTGMAERDVCIGDVYALGTARVQLCQPRTPCWKIEARHGVDGMTQHIAQQGIAGWYYRVLAGGEVGVGDDWMLLERAPEAVTLAEFHATLQQHRPAPAVLERLRDAHGLASGWQARLQQRIDWLRANPS